MLERIWQGEGVQPTRRSVLTAGVLIPLGGLGAACTSSRPATPHPVDPDLALVAAARIREQSLLDAYADVTAAFPHLSVELSQLSSQHLEHLTALGTTTASGTPSVTTRVQRPDTSRGSGDPRTRLAALEHTAATQHGAAAVTASRKLAPLLASLAACEASHAVVLGIL